MHCCRFFETTREVPRRAQEYPEIYSRTANAFSAQKVRYNPNNVWFFCVRHKPPFLRRVHARPFRARTRLRTEICGFLWRRPVKVTPTVGTTHGPSRTSIRNLRRHLTGSRVSTHVWRTLRTRAKARLLFSLEDTRHIWLVVRAVGSA